MQTKLLALGAAALTLVGGLATLPAHAADDPRIQGCVTSVDEPANLRSGTDTPVEICYTLYRPASASAENPVPVVFQSHGWGGSRTNSATAFADYLDAGLGVLSFDQRGFGASGGKAHVENIDFEGHDVLALVDLLANTDWVAQDGPGDPVLGAIGGSYGGGYQFVGAFASEKFLDKQVFNALAPEITWYDLHQSLAPNDVVRTTWVSALYAAGANAHTDTVHQGFAYGAATGQWPSADQPGSPVDLNEFFRNTGPKGHLEAGLPQLDIPVLFGQGITDNLFNLNQGLSNWANTLSDDARAQSLFVGYNGGHVLPEALPYGTSTSGDACSSDLGYTSFSKLALAFLRQHLLGEPAAFSGRASFNLTTNGGTCVQTTSVTDFADYDLGTLAATSGLGAPVQYKVADGPLTVTGASQLLADVTTAGVDSRAFFGLSVGTSPADAQLVQGNVMPMHKPLPVVGEATTVELPGVAVVVPAGQSLYLTISPLATMFAGHGSRTPGAIVFENATLRVPLQAL